MNTKKSTCDICGKEIEINKYVSIYRRHTCNDCNNKYKITCIVCGKEFIGSKNKKLCSDQCKKIYNILPTLIKYFNFNKSLCKTTKVFDEIDRIKNELVDLYWNNHLSSTEICKKYNYPNAGNLTGKIFKYLNIKSKTSHESNKENILYKRLNPGKSTKYKQQWYTTWNGKNVYLHSSFELDYAKELDSKQIDYFVEELRIKYWDSQKKEYRCAIPDFYIPNQNLIVEIKSKYTLNLQNMKDKFQAYKKLGYNVKLICDHKELKI